MYIRLIIFTENDFQTTSVLGLSIDKFGYDSNRRSANNKSGIQCRIGFLVSSLE